MLFGKFANWHLLAMGWLCLAFAQGLAFAQAPAFAQTPLSAQPKAPEGASGAPIVVTAPTPLAPGEKPSDWKRADSAHLIVYSNGSEDQLRRVTENLERLHALLARLYGAPNPGREPAPLEVVLFDSTDAVRNLNLHAHGPTEGPFAGSFAGQRYYDPRPDGSVLALARVDQVVAMDTDKARDADCEDLAQEGGDCIGKRPSFHPPVTRPWEEVLYGAYAQHMILHYASVRYPRWYVDGIGALFSTVVFRRDGAIEYGRPPEGYRAVFRSYGRLDTASVLNGDYLNAPTLRMDWTPYHAWLITHFFVLSNLKGQERAQFAAYMTAIANGRPMAEAARAFGATTTRLARAVAGYAERPHDFATTEKAKAEEAPVVTPLSRPAADALLASLASHT